MPSDAQVPAPDTDFDPAAVPIQPAATVMIVADRPDLQVLMIERNAGMVFAGGMWVFPGGRVDPADADDFESRCHGIDDAAASRALRLEAGGLAYWVAAIRESFEEAGLLLGRHEDGRPIDVTSLQVERGQVDRGERSFLSVVEEHALHLDTSAMRYVGHWLTPVGSPRRYSARFFVSQRPHGQEVTHDEFETVGSEWIAPSAVLARHAAGEVTMMPPTVRMLRSLAEFDSAADVLAAADEDRPHARVHVTGAGAAPEELLLPGDPGYEDAPSGGELGWVKLRRPD